MGWEGGRKEGRMMNSYREIGSKNERNGKGVEQINISEIIRTLGEGVERMNDPRAEKYLWDNKNIRRRCRTDE